MDEEMKEREAPQEEICEEEALKETPEAEAEGASPESEEKASDDKKNKKEEKKYKAKAASLEKENAELKAKLEGETDSRLRIAAEYENFRKRTQKEKDGIYSDAVSDTLKELLPLLDDLDRAATYMDGDNVGEGLALILKTVPDVLSKLKVEPFGEAGEQFDPNLHDAMMHEENEAYGENEIVEVFRKGYKTGEKIIRHALVKVAN
ncbi:MAG: nucleotide exchange factor GrpE [Clostridia bacterium]|nr:nucleotide exchange factor GrpE [Clostridia bacterium]